MFIAQNSSEAASGAFNLLLVLVVFGGLFLFMSLRQRKRLRERNEFLATLEVGDEVRSYGGVLGTIESIDDEAAVVVTEGTRLRLVRAAIAARVSSE
jgi:preprotein translocase subunit YajC